MEIPLTTDNAGNNCIIPKQVKPDEEEVEVIRDGNGILQRISLAIIKALETFFYNWGFNIAKRPWLFIVSCLIFTLLCSLGLITFTPENRPDKLWIPWNSHFVRDSDWLRENFPSPIRFHYAIISSPNVLDPEVLKILLDIHEKVNNLCTPDEQLQWKDICFKLPVIKFDLQQRRKRDLELGEDIFTESIDNSLTNTESPSSFDPSFRIGQHIYCELLSSLEEQCWESNIAELWSFNETLIHNVSQDEILYKVNTKQISPIFGRPVNYTTELGEVTRNATGHITNAKAIMVRWFAKINQTALLEGKIKNDLGTGENVDQANLEWEKELATFLNTYPLPKEVRLHFNVARSFGDISGDTIWGDVRNLAAGFSIVFIYVIFMLGQWNMVEQRPLLSLAGLGCVGLAILVSYGICSAFKIIYGPVHNILPFLLMGIGIDDMFVIMQCFNNLSPEIKKLPLEERIGQTLQQAGVSITVTSITDFVAFAIGATTVLPALQSFCIYAAFGILATYIFQATFFVAFLVIDQKRVESNYNAFLICYQHKNYTPNSCSQRNYAQLFLEKIYCRFLFQKCTKVIVFLITFIVLGVNMWGNTQLRQEFNPVWFLPQDSYLFQYFMARDNYFPERGDDGFILFQNLSFPAHLKSFDALNQKLQEFSYIHEIDSFYPELEQYLQYNFNKSLSSDNLTEKQFYKYFGRFLFSPSGSKFRGRIKVDGNLTCGRPAPRIEITNIGFKFKLFKGPEDHVVVMNKLKSLVKNFETQINLIQENGNNSARAFVWSFAFAGWETDEIITAELYRNMSLAMLCVMITTLVLIANVKTCLMVLSCVLFTLLNVAGSMHFWGLTIDTVSCIDLVLAIGLCVDYAAHIGHAFMTCRGSREERAKEALITIGPAVLNGGFSTFLAFVLLANSKSHVFMTFFKIFFLVVVYGLYHGLIFLPVLLSLIGPPPYPTARMKSKNPAVIYQDNIEQIVPLRIFEDKVSN